MKKSNLLLNREKNERLKEPPYRNPEALFSQEKNQQQSTGGNHEMRKRLKERGAGSTHY